MEKIKIIKEPTIEKPFIVLYKPKGLPSAPLTSDAKENALFQAMSLYPEIKNVSGKKDIEYGLLHRLDTATDGLLVIATTQEAYDFINEEQKQNRFIKYYKALCIKDINDENNLEGFPDVKPQLIKNRIIAKSFFRSYGPGNKEVRPVIESSGKSALKKVGKMKEYTTEISILNQFENKILVECKISEGFRHQVRCHLAWSGYPIIGDKLYNSDKKNAEEQLRFSATKIEFEYPKGDLNSYEITFTWT